MLHKALKEPVTIKRWAVVVFDHDVDDQRRVTTFISALKENMKKLGAHTDLTRWHHNLTAHTGIEVDQDPCYLVADGSQAINQVHLPCYCWVH